MSPFMYSTIVFIYFTLYSHVQAHAHHYAVFFCLTWRLTANISDTYSCHRTSSIQKVSSQITFFHFLNIHFFNSKKFGVRSYNPWLISLGYWHIFSAYGCLFINNGLIQKHDKIIFLFDFFWKTIVTL